MKKYFALFLIAFFAVNFNIQAKPDMKSDAAALELAKLTLKALGGDKFAQAKTIVVRGSVAVTAPNAPQTLPAAFAMIYAGEKYRFEIQSAFFNFSQISDGIQTSSSVAEISLPPITRVGLAILPRIEESGFIVSPLPEKLKKKKGFRITSPEGYYTDFIIDEKTSLVKEYESSYELNGRTISTAVAIDKYRLVEGILINENFSQRIEMGSITAYANFKAKEISVNSAVGDDIFTIK